MFSYYVCTELMQRNCKDQFPDILINEKIHFINGSGMSRDRHAADQKKYPVFGAGMDTDLTNYTPEIFIC